MALSPFGQILALAVNNDIRFYRLQKGGDLDLLQTVKQRAFALNFADENHLAVITDESGPAEPRLLVYRGRDSNRITTS